VRAAPSRWRRPAQTGQAHPRACTVAARPSRRARLVGGGLGAVGRLVGLQGCGVLAAGGEGVDLDWLVGWTIGCLFGWFVGSSVGGWVGRLVGRLVGWAFGPLALEFQTPSRPTNTAVQRRQSHPLPGALCPQPSSGLSQPTKRARSRTLVCPAACEAWVEAWSAWWAAWSRASPALFLALGGCLGGRAWFGLEDRLVG
jgi:hypothetical protein